MKNATRTLSLLLALGIPAVSTGCGDDGADVADDDGGGPLYLAATRVFGTDGPVTSYFYVLPSLEQGTVVDPAEALEAAGPAKLFAVEDVGWFAIGGGESPTITRYSIDDEGALAEGEKISLQDYGITNLWDSLYVVSPAKMYYPDREGSRLIAIDPTAMIIEGEIELPDTARNGYLSLYGYKPVLRDNLLLLSVGWFDWSANDTVIEETGLVAIDTETDEVVRFDIDTRCGGITQPLVLASGDAYFVSSALAGAAHRLGRLTSQPCALRILAGDDAFDPDYLLSLDELTSAPVTGEPVPAGGDSLFLRVFDEDLAVVEEGSASWDLTGQAAWRWLRWDTATDEIAAIDELAPSTSDVAWFQVEERVFGTETQAHYSETTIIDLTAEGGPQRGLTAPGFLHGAARIR